MSSIRIIFLSLFLVISLMMAVLGFLFVQIDAQSTLLNQRMKATQERILLAQELKQSSDNLTKFARAYAATSNPKWKQLFNQVLAVRNGTAPIPDGHQFEYWDQVAMPSEMLISGSNSDKRYASLMERMSQSGISDAELGLLRQALAYSDNLVNLERQAFDAVEGIARNKKGLEKVSPDPSRALDVLFSNTYFQEKGRIINPIGDFYRAVSDRSQTEWEQTSTYLRDLSSRQQWIFIVMSLTLLGSFILLWRWCLAPADKMQKRLVNQVAKRDYQFQLSEADKGAFAPQAKALNLIFSEVSAQLKSNASIKEFTDVMRDSENAEDFGRRIIDFLTSRFQLPLMGLYTYDNGQLSRISGFGYSEDASRELTAADSIQMSLLYSKKHFALRDLGEKYKIPLVSGELTLSELHFFPLQVNDRVIGLLELGTATPLKQDSLDWLGLIRADLAINLELTRNAEQQAKAERLIAEQLEFNQQVLNAIPSPMYYRDTEGRYLGVNNGFSDFIGMFETDILQNVPDALFPPEIAAIFNNAEKALLETPGTTQYELNLKNADGQQRHVSIYEATYYSSKGAPKGIVGLFVDVTEQKDLELELRSAKDAADDASKAKGEFLANMSHEIRTPMNAIIGMAHLALNSGLNDKQHHYVTKIDNAAKSLLGIINDILDFSKVEAGKLSVENIDFLLDEVLDNLANVIGIKADEKGLEFLFDIEPNLPTALVGDPLRLAQVLINLCGNSIKFTEKGEVIVRVKQTDQFDDGIMLQVEIQDSGIGMTKDQQSRLFKSFSQADGSITRKYGGTGLGLTISKSLVELMGGRIWVTSEPGKGSTFGFTIKAGLQDAKAKRFYQPQEDMSDKRILVVDDNDAAREIMLGLLKAMTFKVSTVSTGFEAISAVNKADAEGDPFEVIFMDWMLPGMDGIETTRQLREKQYSTRPRIIMVTAYGREIGLSGENEKLFDGLVIKPVNPSLIFDSIMNAFGIQREAKLPTNRIKQATDGSTMKNARLLLVEDNETNQEVAKGILEPYEPVVVIANNGQEALDMLAKESFDLVLMDMQMPVMDGITATREIRKDPTLRDLPVLAMTANAMEQDITNCLDAGMNDHIGKPISVDELVSKICRWLGKDSEPTEDTLQNVIPLEQDNGSTDALEASDSATAASKKAPKSVNAAGGKSADDHYQAQVLDIEDGLSRLGGNKKLYWQITDSFLQSRKQELDTLSNALEEADYDYLRLAGHTIKGAAANISADKLSQLGRQLETHGANKQLPDPDFILTLRDLLEKLEQDIQHLGPSKEVIPQPVREVRPYDADEFMMELQQLSMLVQNFDTQAIDFIELLKQNAEALSELGIDFTLVEEAINEFDFTKAQTELDKLITQSKTGT
ncbi:response regulator [Shewanella sp. GXUN23E]|uniref:response regulator n=1 Tax=Shewanella sp. GXUN23E TaxID=3422498 RepID=UPI003D7EF55F